jgi:uncharacterized protein
VLELSFDVALAGPCFRCLSHAELPVSLRLREYSAGSAAGKAGDARRGKQRATKPEGDEEQTEYLADDRLDLSAWARDSIALALPDQILCRDDCAGLCPICGKDLNAEPHEHVEERTDPRWEKLSQLRQE